MNWSNFFTALDAFLQQLIHGDQTPPQPTPDPLPPVPPPTPHTSLLGLFCEGIKAHEDYVLPGGRYRNGQITMSGSLSYRNQNPGNFRCSQVGYLPKYGDVQCVNRFAVFPTYDQGWDYLQNSVKERARNHKDWDFYKFFAVYAPISDNNDPIAYAEAVASHCGVPPTTKLSSILL